MANLIIVVISIGLTATLLAATVSYLPSWQPEATSTQRQVAAGFEALARAFVLHARANNGAPAPLAGADGGMAALFEPYYGFVPRPPKGYAWRYGYSSAYGLHWFCLYPTGAGANKGIFQGLRRAAQGFSPQQYYLGAEGEASCGTAGPAPTGDSFPAPVSATLFVRYIPDT